MQTLNHDCLDIIFHMISVTDFLCLALTSHTVFDAMEGFSVHRDCLPDVSDFRRTNYRISAASELKILRDEFKGDIYQLLADSFEASIMKTKLGWHDLYSGSPYRVSLLGLLDFPEFQECLISLRRNIPKTRRKVGEILFHLMNECIEHYSYSKIPIHKRLSLYIQDLKK